MVPIVEDKSEHIPNLFYTEIIRVNCIYIRILMEVNTIDYQGLNSIIINKYYV